MKAESYVVLIWIIGSIAIGSGCVRGGWLLKTTGADVGNSVSDVWLPFGTYTDISGVRFKLVMSADDMVTLYQDRDMASAQLSRNLVLKGDGVEVLIKGWTFNGDPTTSGMFLADITVSPPLLNLTAPLWRPLTFVRSSGGPSLHTGSISCSHVNGSSVITIAVLRGTLGGISLAPNPFSIFQIKVTYADGSSISSAAVGVALIATGQMVITRSNYLAATGEVTITITEKSIFGQELGKVEISDISFPPIRTSTPVLPDPSVPPRYSITVKAIRQVGGSQSTAANVQFKWDEETLTTPKTKSAQTGYHYITIVDTSIQGTPFRGWDTDGDYSSVEYMSSQHEVSSADNNRTFTAVYWEENLEQKIKDATVDLIIDAVNDFKTTYMDPVIENLNSLIRYFENLANTVTGLGDTTGSIIDTILSLQLSDNIIAGRLTTPNILVFSSFTMNGGLPNWFSIQSQNAMIDSVTVTDGSGTLYSGTGNWFSVTPKAGSTLELEIKYTPTDPAHGGQQTYNRSYQVNYTISYYLSGDNQAGSSTEYAQVSLTPIHLIIIGGIIALVTVIGIKLWRRRR